MSWDRSLEVILQLESLRPVSPRSFRLAMSSIELRVDGIVSETESNGPRISMPSGTLANFAFRKGIGDGGHDKVRRRHGNDVEGWIGRSGLTLNDRGRTLQQGRSPMPDSEDEGFRLPSYAFPLAVLLKKWNVTRPVHCSV